MNVRRTTLVAGLAAAALIATACGPATQPTPTPVAETQPAEPSAPGASADLCGDKTKLAKELNWYTWGNYVSDDVLARFTELCGVTVKVDVYSSNEEMEAKFKAGGNPGYDLITPSDYMVAKMIAADLLEKLDFNNIPNFQYVGDDHKGLFFDPKNEYSVPYFWGTTGIAYDTTKVKEPITSWKQIMEPDDALSGKISLLDDMRETMGMALRYKGFSANTSNPDEINAARDALIAHKKHVRAYTDSPTAATNLGAGDVIAAMIYVNDALVAKEQNPNIEYVIPKDVSTVWQDNLTIPKGAPSKYTAEVFINFMLDPQNAADNSNFVGSGTTNQGAIERGLIDTALTSNKMIYPDVSAMGNALEWLRNLDPQTTDLLQRAWDELKTAQ